MTSGTTRAAGSSTSGSSRRRNPRGEGGQLRRDLIRATNEMLAGGTAPEHISLRGVAAAVGVTAPSIYRHFQNKEALLLAVIEEHFDALQQALAQALTGSGDDPFAALRAMGRAYMTFGREQPAHYEVLFGPLGGAIQGLIDTGPAEPGRFAPDDAGQGAFMLLVGLVDRALAAGPGGAGFDPFVVAVETWTFVHGLVDLSTKHPGFPWPPVEDVLDSWVARFERAVRGGPAASEGEGEG